MKKRKGGASEDEDSESEVSANNPEEKMEVDSDASHHDGEDPDDDNEDDERDSETLEAGSRSLNRSGSRSAPFLDAFYGLSSTNTKDRAQAAQTMLHHCLVGPDANANDAAYALRRLMNGLCSGRAAARQGNASALAAFLKLSLQLDKIQDILVDEQGNRTTEIPDLLTELRNRLLKATDPSQSVGKKKGSEERDYHFGRLFGILAIIRSNILLSAASTDHEVIQKVASMICKDLVELFWYKKWMREPATHGIITLLSSLLTASVIDTSTDGNMIAKHVIETVLVPYLFWVDSNHQEVQKKKTSLLLAKYSAEQYALAVFIQSRLALDAGSMPFPLNKLIVSSESISLITKELSETSSVIQPRMHIVWDAIWSFFTEPGPNRGQRILREKCPIGDGNTAELVAALFRDVVSSKLLRIEQDESGRATAKTTHERRSLVLCMVKNLCGAAFISSIDGPTQILLPPQVIESVVLSKELVQMLFMDTIVAGTKAKNSSQHLLKPLALDVLSQISAGLSSIDVAAEESQDRRLSIVRSLLRCDVRFEARTKTSIIGDLLMFGAPVSSSEEIIGKVQMWKRYFSSLQKETISAVSVAGDGAIPIATGHIELLYIATKSIIRLEVAEGVDDKELTTFKASSVREVQSFLIASAFFDVGQTEELGNKKTSQKSLSTNPIIHSLLALASKVKVVPSTVRSVAAARFFSLLSEQVYYEVNVLNRQGSESKEDRMLSLLLDVFDHLSAVEENGAVKYCPLSERGRKDDGEDHETSKDPTEIVMNLVERAKKLPKQVKGSPNYQRQYATGSAVLVLTMYFHLLKSGKAMDMLSEDNDDVDLDEEDDEEEIIGIISEINDTTEAFMDWEQGKENPLILLTELCANILSSPLGSGTLTRGTSPKLIKEAVRLAWIGGLSISDSLASKTGQSFLDLSVANTLLEAIGANDGQDNDEDEEDESIGYSGSDEDGDGEDGGDDESFKSGSIFTKAAKLVDDSDDMEVTSASGSKSAPEDESDDDISVDGDKLQAMLEEDSDAEVDIGELEHHEGADAALANLIKLKQEARKASQQATEKLEMANQLRCSFLLEILFAKQELWTKLLRTDTVLHFLVPMLVHRQEIERSMEKTMKKGASSGVAGKRAVVERLTSLVKSKLCKMKLSNIPFTEKTVIPEYYSNLVSQIINLAKNSGSKNQSSCCSSALLFTIRSIPEPSLAEAIATCYCEAMQEWSTKRTSKLESSIFNDFIISSPSLAKSTLTQPLVTAGKEARSSFVKLEVFRMLALLLATKDASDRPDLTVASKLHTSQTAIADLFESTLQDEEMKASKRIRVVLKAMEKYIDLLTPPLQSGLQPKIQTCTKLLEELISSSDNAGIKNAAEKIRDSLKKKNSDLIETQPKEKSVLSMTQPLVSNKKSKSKRKSKSKKKNR